MRVEPIVRASRRRNVPPSPLKFNGKSRVLPLVVMVRGVADVDVKIVVLIPAVSVIPVDKVKLPKIFLPLLPNVPANPVKLRLRTLPLFNVSEYVPAVKLKLIVSDSAKDPGLTVVAVAVLLVMLTTGVPVHVSPPVVPVFHTVPVLVTAMLPVPNAMVLVLLLLLAKVVTVSVLLLRARVPRVNVKVFVDVAASTSRKVPPGASKIIGKVTVLPAVVKFIVPRPANV